MCADNQTNNSHCLPLTESFYSLQGEGFYCGTPAYFVRLAGCGVGCVWCDSKNSWQSAKHPDVPVESIAAQILQTSARVVVITGGEPLLHNLTSLCTALKNKGLMLHLETSGAYQLSGRWDWVTLSPKKQKPPLPAIFRYANELKVIVFDESDLIWAEQNAVCCNPQCHLFLQPEWSNFRHALPMAIEYVKKYPQWKFLCKHTNSRAYNNCLFAAS